MADIELAKMFAEMEEQIERQPSVSEALEETVRLAVEAIPGAEMAGVSWCTRKKQMETPFATDAIIDRIDALQYELDEGPALSATEDGTSVLINDLRFETRWERFTVAARDLGISSVLSCQLSSPRSLLGALNLYSRKPDAFDDEAVELAQIYASHASIVLAGRSLETNLKAAVDSRGVIGQAMGILIERYKVNPGQAFDLLVKGSQNKHLKLRDLAAFVVETGLDPQSS
jgi:transcriptional regulator with GAF, ATPase, and Fis domain